MTVSMSRSAHACWKCGDQLWRIDPAIGGWTYYCERCLHLTSTQAELSAAMETKPKGSVGIVSAVSCRIEVRRIAQGSRSSP